MEQRIGGFIGALRLGTLALAMALASGQSLAQAREKISVVLDFTPWGIHAAMHLAKHKR